MAICKLCKREMKTAHGCVCHNYVHDGKAVAAIKYGSEDYDFPVSKNSVCHDCNARPGEYHHIGCDMEQCPVCGGQLLSCECFEERMQVLISNPDAP